MEDLFRYGNRKLSLASVKTRRQSHDLQAAQALNGGRALNSVVLKGSSAYLGLALTNNELPLSTLAHSLSNGPALGLPVIDVLRLAGKANDIAGNSACQIGLRWRDIPVRLFRGVSVNGASLGERLIVPAVVWLLVGAMSGLFMYGSGGATGRMRIVFRYSMLFTGGLFYCIAWKDVLARILGCDGAWIAVALGFAGLSFWLCRAHFRGHLNGKELH